MQTFRERDNGLPIPRPRKPLWQKLHKPESRRNHRFLGIAPQWRFLHGISDEGVPRSALYPKRTLTAPADKHTTEVTSPRRREQERREGARSPPGAGGGEGRRRSGNTAGSPHQSPNDARRAGRSSANAPPQSEPSEDPGLNVFRSQRRASSKAPSPRQTLKEEELDEQLMEALDQFTSKTALHSRGQHKSFVALLRENAADQRKQREQREEAYRRLEAELHVELEEANKSWPPTFGSKRKSSSVSSKARVEVVDTVEEQPASQRRASITSGAGKATGRQSAVHVIVEEEESGSGATQEKTAMAGAPPQGSTGAVQVIVCSDEESSRSPARREKLEEGGAMSAMTRELESAGVDVTLKPSAGPEVKEQPTSAGKKVPSVDDITAARIATQSKKRKQLASSTTVGVTSAAQVPDAAPSDSETDESVKNDWMTTPRGESPSPTIVWRPVSRIKVATDLPPELKSVYQPAYHPQQPFQGPAHQPKPIVEETEQTEAMQDKSGASTIDEHKAPTPKSRHAKSSHHPVAHPKRKSNIRPATEGAIPQSAKERARGLAALQRVQHEREQRERKNCAQQRAKHYGHWYVPPAQWSERFQKHKEREEHLSKYGWCDDDSGDEEATQAMLDSVEQGSSYRPGQTSAAAAKQKAQAHLARKAAYLQSKIPTLYISKAFKTFLKHNFSDRMPWYVEQVSELRSSGHDHDDHLHDHEDHDEGWHGHVGETVASSWPSVTQNTKE